MSADRARLIAALPGAHPWGEVVDALLPVVQALVAEKAAAELRAAADEIGTWHRAYGFAADHARDRIRASADALDPT